MQKMAERYVVGVLLLVMGRAKVVERESGVLSDLQIRV
jgi:hypothetical protein